MSTFIFLDTNNWIYLSNGFDVRSKSHENLHFKLFDFITQRVDEGSLVILVNDIVIEEWRRNKTEAEKQLTIIKKTYKTYSSTLKAIQKFVGGEKEFDKIQKVLKKQYDKKIKQYRKHVNLVEQFLLTKTVKIDVSDSVKVEATNLALAKKAPFIGDKKNSMADALILLSSIEHIYENEKYDFHFLEKEDEGKNYFPLSYFVSSNSGDFSAPNDNENVHPDLAPYLEKTKTNFYYSLGKLINSLEDRFLSEEELEVIEHYEDEAYCEACNFDYAPTLHFSEYDEIYNPNKKFIDKKQRTINFPGEEPVEVPDYKTTPMDKIRYADCSYCGASFFECMCGELIPVEWDDRLECPGGCGTVYNVRTDAYRGEGVGDFEVEIVKVVDCDNCGCETESVNEFGRCPDCEEREEKYIND